MDSLYPVGHSPLHCSYWIWKLRSFNVSEQSAINAFLICLESHDWGVWVIFWLSERGHFPPSIPQRWTFGCKYTTFFWKYQICKADFANFCCKISPIRQIGQIGHRMPEATGRARPTGRGATGRARPYRTQMLQDGRSPTEKKRERRARGF